MRHYRALHHWFQSPLGMFVAQEFAFDLEHASEYLKGETLLQLGDCGANPWLDALGYQYQWISSPFLTDFPIHLECAFNQIPLDRSSVDCVLVPLSSEPFGSSLSLIDEIDRILKPMGFVIFLSINPWSLWGAALKSGLLSCYADKKVAMRSPFHLNRILLQRGYRQVSLSNFCYIPPINNETAIKKLTFLNEVGKMLWPFPSGFYCYIAQKYELIKPSLTAQAIVEPIGKEYESPLQPALNNDSAHNYSIIQSRARSYHYE